MWVGVVGSRKFGRCTCPAKANWPPVTPHPEDCEMVKAWLLVLNVVTRLTKAPGFEGIVSGGAEGADTFAENAATVLGVKCIVYRPEGGRRPFATRARERNEKIVKKLGTMGWLIALFAPGERSPGTSHTLAVAKAKSLKTHVYQEGRWTLD